MDKEKCENEVHSCNHCHSHNHHEKQDNKNEIYLYILSVILFILAFIPFFAKYKMLLFLVCILVSGYKLIIDGIKNIFKLNFEENTLMTIAIIAAFVLGEFPESAMVVLLFKLGEFLEEKAVENSNKNIKDIVDIKPKTANLLDDNENEKQVAVEDVKVGEKIIIKPGEMVPLDSKIIKGTSSLDMSSVTGESVPVFVGENENILSGSINLTGSLICITQKDYKNSTASQIVDLVYEATNNKGKTEKFITKFSKVYTPIVMILALIISIVIPLLLNQEFNTWILRALVFLVASCPCSIVISVPLAFFSCIGKISKKGMLIKGTKHIESLANSKFIAFDKTGTLTTGKLKIDRLDVKGEYSKDEILKYMYALEKNSNHPISTAIKEKVEKENIKVNYIVDNYEEIAGCGIKANVNNKEILFGNEKLLKIHNINEKVEEHANYLIIDGKLEGYVNFKEEIREDALNLSNKLKKINIKKTIMLTGDNIKNAELVSKKVNVDQVKASLLPKDKLEEIRKLKKEGRVIFVGDGINDSPVLKESDFGISMGEASEIANNSADGILISNKISSLVDIIKIARKSMRIIKFNIIFSLLIKLIVLSLGILGIAPIWLAVLADTGVSLITVINSLRILK